MTLQRTKVPVSSQSSSPRRLQLLGLLALEDKDRHSCSHNDTLLQPRNINILPIPMFMLSIFTCTALSISHHYYQCVQHVGGRTEVQLNDSRQFSETQYTSMKVNVNLLS